MEDEDLLQDGDLTATKLQDVLEDDIASKQSQEDLDEQEHENCHANSTRDDNENGGSAESPLDNGEALDDLAESIEASFDGGKQQLDQTVVLLEEGTDILYEDESEEESEEECDEDTMILEEGCVIADDASDSDEEGAGLETAAKRQVRFEGEDKVESEAVNVTEQTTSKK